MTRDVFLTTTLRWFTLSSSLPSPLISLSGLRPHIPSFRDLIFRQWELAIYLSPRSLLLTSDRVVIPGPSYVIRIAPLVASGSQVFRDTPFMPIVIGTHSLVIISSLTIPKNQTGNYLRDDLIEEAYSLASFENDSVRKIFYILRVLVID